MVLSDSSTGVHVIKGITELKITKKLGFETYYVNLDIKLVWYHIRTLEFFSIFSSLTQFPLSLWHDTEFLDVCNVFHVYFQYVLWIDSLFLSYKHHGIKINNLLGEFCPLWNLVPLYSVWPIGLSVILYKFSSSNGQGQLKWQGTYLPFGPPLPAFIISVPLRGI